MNNKFSALLILAMLSGAAALAQEARPVVEVVKPKTAIDKLIQDKAKESGKSEDEVRREAIESLRLSKKFKKADLEKIGIKEIDFSPSVEKAMVEHLKGSKEFSARIGLESKKLSETSDATKKAIEEMTGKSNKSILVTEADKEIAAVMQIEKDLGKTVVLAVEGSGKNRADLKKVALKLAKRVREGQLKQEVAQQIVLKSAESAAKLNGELITGEGVKGACAEMSAEALANYAEFLSDGVTRGSDAKTITEEMSKSAAEKFKQEFEKGKERICALASGSCKMFSKAIVDACMKI